MGSIGRTAHRAVVLLFGCTAAPTSPSPDPTIEDTSAPIIDVDGDGYSPPEDCNDDVAGIHPGATYLPTVCMGGDHDCDGVQDGEADADEDGFTTCDFRECDDGDPTRFPGAIDPFGDGFDQDCDGTDGVGLDPILLASGDRRNYAFGQNLLVADVNGDGCADLVSQASGPTMLALGGNGIGLNQSRILAWLGCGAGTLSFERDEPSGLTLLDHLPTPSGDLLLAVSYDAFAAEARIVDLAANAYIGPPLHGTGSGSMHDGAVLVSSNGPPQSVFAGPADLTRPPVGFHHPWAADYASPDVEWFPDPDSAGVQYGWDLLGFDRDDDGIDDLVLSAMESMSPTAGAVHVFEVPVATPDQATEIWLGDLVGFGSLFGERLYGARDLHNDGAPTLLVASRAFFGLRGGLVSLPPIGPGTHTMVDVGIIAEGEFEWDFFGYSAAIGDLDGDGQKDLAVGAPGQLLPRWPPVHRGKVYVWFGPIAQDALLSRVEADAVFVGPQVGEHLGWSLAILDLDGDGQDELYASAPFHTATLEDGTEVEDAGGIYRLDL